MNIIEFTQSQNVSLSAFFMVIYMVAIYIKKPNKPCVARARISERLTRYLKTNEVVTVSLVCFAIQIYCMSPLYNITIAHSGKIVFLVYASIYFTAMNFLSSYKVLSACFIMAVFEVIMYKAYLNELGNKGIENGLYDNYEYIVTLLHLNILLSMVRWDIVRSTYRSIRDNLLRPFLYERCLLPY